QDFFETFLIIEGEVKDNTSGVVMKPNGKVHMWKKGTPHEPEAMKDSILMIFCKKSNN
ncbi:MAG: hypothetical protein JKY22_11920, partial [Flavobacteriaceae bacterium]|nr:hypothetical protein [Flavobacteriaceae bacterium]